MNKLVATEEGDVEVDEETGEILEPEPVPEPETEPEPFEDPEPQAVTDERQAVALDKALTAEDTRHQKALGKALGDTWPEHVRCSLCDGVGFLSPELAAGLTTEQWDKLLETAVSLVTMPLVPDPNYERCTNCDGWGKTISGSQNAEHYTKLCDVCSGNGYNQRAPRLPQIQPLVADNGASASPVAAIPSYGSPAADDLWGRPGGHPHYGIPPAAVT
jgi:hypothetical protein